MKRGIKHWQDVVSVLVGIWLIASPWVLGFSGPLQAVGGFVALGVLLAICAVTEMFIPEPWEEWSELLLGLWLIGSPWVLEFTQVQAAAQNAVTCGTIVCVMAVWVLVTDPEWGVWFMRRMR
jgi:hypothetical protein